MKPKVYQIQISLRNFKPKIWRRILVQADLSLNDFHRIIQTTMGWSNSHLHQFIRDRVSYTKNYPDTDFVEDEENINYKSMKISDLLKKEKDRLFYEYDFGDSWEHDIILEQVITDMIPPAHPICVKGKKCCPPDDCGGVGGYENMLNILKQPGHEEYKSTIEWLGYKFNPDYFEIDKINDLLKEEDFGCFEF